MTQQKRLLTGDRPTGKLHLGHYVGSLQNRVRLQDEYECFFIIADLHTLTTHPDRPHVEQTSQNIREILLDYVAAGIDPDKATIFVQSNVLETYELNLYLEMMVNLPRLSQLSSVKAMARAASLDEEALPFGLIGYPVLQAADILLSRAHLVPVGKDNEAHVEVAQEIARRFNQLYGPVFTIPEVMLGDVPVLIGTDGQTKMSKSLGNAIFLSDDQETVNHKVGEIPTPQREPGDVANDFEDSPLFVYHDVFNADRQEVKALQARYRQGEASEAEVKERLARALNAFLDPLRERRAYYEARPELLERFLTQGTRRTQAEARQTMAQVRAAVGLYRVPGIDLAQAVPVAVNGAVGA
jgi:tryptophanyl-tRNA synthetase